MQATAIPANDLNVKPVHKPPAHGGPQRDAIGSILDGSADNFCQKTNALRAEIDRIEQKYLQSTAHAKSIVNGHTEAGVMLDAELTHLQAVIADIDKRISEA